MGRKIIVKSAIGCLLLLFSIVCHKLAIQITETLPVFTPRSLSIESENNKIKIQFEKDKDNDRYTAIKTWLEVSADNGAKRKIYPKKIIDTTLIPPLATQLITIYEYEIKDIVVSPDLAFSHYCSGKNSEGEITEEIYHSPDWLAKRLQEKPSDQTLLFEDENANNKRHILPLMILSVLSAVAGMLQLFIALYTKSTDTFRTEDYQNIIKKSSNK